MSEVDEFTETETSGTESSATQVPNRNQAENRQCCDKVAKIICTLFGTKFKIQTAITTIIFLLAIKVARECYAIKLPLKQYVPFQHC